jgi:general secretion pathway protein F
VPLFPNTTPTTQQLVMLNDELLALVRAGIPLDQGLKLSAKDMPGQLRQIAEQLAGQLEQGQTLEEALRSQPVTFPATYRALVIAGIKSQQLPVILEKIASALKRIVLIRKTVRRSMAYPVFVLAIAYLFFLAFTAWVTPQIAETYWDLARRDEWLMRGMLTLSKTMQWWWPLPPLVAMLLWSTGTRLATVRNPGRTSSLRWTPWRRLERLGQLAIFSEVLALLVQQEEPLPSALILAGETTGSNQLAHESRLLAARMELGEQTPEPHASPAEWGPETWPPLLTWTLLSSRSSSRLAESLHRFSLNYQRQADRLALTLSFFYPVVVGTLMAGMGLFAYAIWVTFPWYLLLYRLGDIT